MLEDFASFTNVLLSYNSTSPSNSQEEITEKSKSVETYEPEALAEPPQSEQLEEVRSLVNTALSVLGSCSHLSSDGQEPSHHAQEPATDKPPLSKVDASTEFRAQMVKDTLSLKNTLPPSRVALDKTLALMNSRVILPSLETVRWFSNKGYAGKDPHVPLSSVHRKCAQAYCKVPESTREPKEHALFRELLSFIGHSSLELTDDELMICALHRRQIYCLANQIVDSTTDGASAQARDNSQSYTQSSLFDYSAYNPCTRPRICLCLALQLLTSGFFSYIPASYIPLLQSALASNGGNLVSYMLGPSCVEIFSVFITAFYIIRSNMCTDAESSMLLECHSDIVSSLPTSTRLMYGDELAAQKLHLCRLARDYRPALCALGAGELTDNGSALQTATERISAYWHALSTLAMLTIPIPKNNDAVHSKSGTIDPISTVIEHTALADRFLQFLAPPVATTASLSCWAAVLTALTYMMPSIDVYAFMVAHTPPPFAGPLLRSEVINVTAYVIIVSLWLVFRMPHTDSILANLDAMYANPAYRYKALLLMRLPVSLFARASPRLLCKISRIVFEQEHARKRVRQESRSLKRQAKGRLKSTRYASKRSCGTLQVKAGAAPAREDTLCLSDDSTPDEAQVNATPIEIRWNRKRWNRKRKLSCSLSTSKSFKQPSIRDGMTKNVHIPLTKLFLNLYIHCRTPDDLTDEELANLMCNRGTLCYLMKMCNMIANEVPQIQSMSKAGYLYMPSAKVLKELLRLFGTLSHAATSAYAGQSGTLCEASEQNRGGAACAMASETASHDFSRPEGTALGGHFSASDPSHTGATGTYDIYWDMLAGSRHCIATLPVFFARQLLPYLIDAFCTNPYAYTGGELLNVVEHILDANDLAGNMQLVERTLSSIAAALEKLHQEYTEFAAITAQLADKAQPGMPRFVLRSNPAICLPLPDMEMLAQQCMGSTFLDARAYMEISDALHRLLFQMLGATNFIQEKFATASGIRRIFTQIMGVLPRECPFVYCASGSEAQAQIKCTWSPVFRSAPLRASPTAIPVDQVVYAIKNTCFCYLHAFNTDAHVDGWLQLLTWLFTRSPVQSLIASPAILLSERDNKTEADLAAAIASCQEDINSLSARIMAGKAKEATGVDANNNGALAPVPADGYHDDPYRSLVTIIAQLLTLFNISKKMLNTYLAKFNKKE